ncbi:acyl-coenzyme A thioesterase 1-like isoform X1 [Gymnodraco acuticeps]|uniref:Acyl-coenzyme A thioesterase 1-like isoform X1 n=2 Tax=Gymnodraco acuticeps TaxID=8218 RepID=A0A6P8V8N9_GYMAC|nr:acyl-coenzyme A thioesterase 1-like isoform X1 [Gymnodraco acuticeps]XP_034081990.1 acyl-coenzyme A thioesterase 1-like isoform X1 [Gymnodraco acuticeps]XP_034081991.1 acyl-coenzyme A thioesterase 1-like isoform X1 [Gymnodraco acuticeps]
MFHTGPPVVSVHPSRAMVDEAFKVQVENLPPGSPVTLHSLHQSEDKDYWEAFGHYVSDHRGTVSVADDLSCGGTYTGKEAMGLLWSMRPVPGSREGLRLRKLNVCIPQLVNISVYSGHVGVGFREQDPLASVLTERWYMAPGVRRIDIKEKGVRGTLFIPHGPGPFPGLLDMWGGGGGLLEYRAALLASHGYASMALEYFNPAEVNTAELELNYFETAFNIVRDHPQVMSDRVGLFGLSLGSIVSISLAAWSSVVKPRCCVCISGNHTHARGGTIGDVFNEFITNVHKVRMDENNYEIWRGMGLPIPDDISQKVDVGKINCPILLVNGDDDQNWPTVESAEDMAQMMRAAGNEHLLTRLEYPDAGHLIEPPYSPHFRATKFLKDGQKVILLWGGTTKPHSDAQEDSWKKILAFLQQNMYSSSGPRAKL